MTMRPENQHAWTLMSDVAQAAKSPASAARSRPQVSAHTNARVWGEH